MSVMSEYELRIEVLRVMIRVNFTAINCHLGMID